MPVCAETIAFALTINGGETNVFYWRGDFPWFGGELLSGYRITQLYCCNGDFFLKISSE